MDAVNVEGSNIEKIQYINTTLSKTEGRSFLGLVEYFGHFIWGSTDIVAPINASRSTKKLRWTEEMEEIFVYLKNTLITLPLLTYPYFDKHFKVDTDFLKVLVQS